MSLRLPIVALLFAPLLALPLGAQTVRGNIIDESTKLPVAEVVVTLVDNVGSPVAPTVRSDSAGNFIVHASRPGTYRVNASRIGYRALRSDPVSLSLGQLVVLRLRMTTVAQQLVPIRVVERRALKLDELMSTSGFDLRESKGAGRFLNAQELAGYGLESAAEVLRSYLRPHVEIGDTLGGSYMYMRGSRGVQCAPEVYVDGHILTKPGDEIFLRQAAFAMLETYPANQLHGVEVYRSNQVPPPSLGGTFGMESFLDGGGFMRMCGVVAVWTKYGALRRALTVRRGGTNNDLQVIRGVVIDQESGKPVSGVPVTLLNEARNDLADPVRTDSLGEFTIRTNRFGMLRLGAGSIGYRAATTDPFGVAPRELVLVKVFVSRRSPVLAPLGIAARLLPESFAITALGGFAYRRERGLSGTFFGAEEIGRTGATTLAEILRGVEGVVVRGAPPASTIAMRAPASPGRICAPAVLIDGVRVPAPADSTLSSVALPSIFGLEIYSSPVDIPEVFADIAGDCGVLGIWLKKG
jgi:hypothetical protein